MTPFSSETLQKHERQCPTGYGSRPSFSLAAVMGPKPVYSRMTGQSCHGTLPWRERGFWLCCIPVSRNKQWERNCCCFIKSYEALGLGNTWFSGMKPESSIAYFAPSDNRALTRQSFGNRKVKGENRGAAPHYQIPLLPGPLQHTVFLPQLWNLTVLIRSLSFYQLITWNDKIACLFAVSRLWYIFLVVWF